MSRAQGDYREQLIAQDRSLNRGNDCVITNVSELASKVTTKTVILLHLSAGESIELRRVKAKISPVCYQSTASKLEHLDPYSLGALVFSLLNL